MRHFDFHAPLVFERELTPFRPHQPLEDRNHLLLSDLVEAAIEFNLADTPWQQQVVA